MELVVVITLMLSLLAFAVRLTFFPKTWVQWVYLIAIGVGVFLAYPMAIEESYTTIQQNMTNSPLIADFSTLVIVEGLFGCLLAISQIKWMFGYSPRKYWAYALYFAGVAVFIAVYYLEALLFINIRGLDFSTLAMVLAVAIPLVLWLTKAFIKWLLPERDLRTEMAFFVHLMQIVLAIVLSVVVLKLPVNIVDDNTHITELLSMLAALVVLATAGYIYQNVKGSFKRH